MSEAMVLNRAIQRGLEFLDERQSGDGHWEDFGISGTSDKWTSAYVGSMLAEINLPNSRRMAGSALAWLREVEAEGRWGYSEEAPHDADTTTWVCRLADRLGQGIGERTRAFLLEHLRPDGRLATFDSSDFVEKFGRDRDRRGWYSGHLCVTAAAASLPDPLIRERTLQALVESQCDDGSWDGYWWLDREYTTALAIEAMVGEPVFESQRARAVKWLMSRVPPGTLIPTLHRPDGSPFASAFAVRGLAMAGKTDVVRSLARRLTEAQDREGGWIASAALRLPYPDVFVPDAEHWAPRDGGTIWDRPLWDQNALHTTATVVNALWHFSIRTGGTALEASETDALEAEPVPFLEQEN